MQIIMHAFFHFTKFFIDTTFTSIKVNSTINKFIDNTTPENSLHPILGSMLYQIQISDNHLQRPLT